MTASDLKASAPFLFSPLVRGQAVVKVRIKGKPSVCKAAFVGDFGLLKRSSCLRLQSHGSSATVPLAAAVTILDLPRLPSQSCCSYHSPAMTWMRLSNPCSRHLFPS